MKSVFLIIGVFAVQTTLLAQAPARVPAPVPFGALPTANQLKWQEMEMYAIIHYGANTYLDHEWGYGDEDPALINPSAFDAKQIVGAAKAGGLKGVIVVAKHHDGLCLWPSATTRHTIAQSPWKDGKGDIVREYQEACGELGMKLGIYCSPWDRNSAAYGTPAYVDIYRRQLTELYTHYGPLFISWHDGANGGDGYYGGAREKRTIDRSNYYGWDSTWAITKKLQPGAVIFGDVGPGIRWVGNEQGFAGKTYWATFSPQAPDSGRKPAPGYILTKFATEGTRHGKYWMPAECDVPLRPGWFYHASQDAQVRTPAQLLDLYYASVGRGADLDLGLAPDKRGRLADADVESLRVFGYLLKQTFAVNLTKDAKAFASNVRGGDTKDYGPAFLLDGDRYSYWATDDSVTTPSVTLDLAGNKTFNVVRLRENIKLGQRIDSFAIDIIRDGSWTTVYHGTTIGPNKLVRFSEPFTTNQVRLRITGSPVCIALSDFGLFREPVRSAAPVFRRDKDGTVTILAKGTVRYTIDNAAPDAHAPVYKKPVALPDGGTIRAAVFGDNGMPGDMATKVFGVSKNGWKVVSEVFDTMLNKSAGGASAIDDNDSTVWNTLSLGYPFSQDLNVDMGKERTIKGFTYLPRQDKVEAGLVSRYNFYVSDNGTDWKMVKGGEFSNIAANPVEQFVPFAHPVNARFFRFEAKAVTSGDGVSVAEIGVR